MAINLSGQTKNTGTRGTEFNSNVPRSAHSHTYQNSLTLNQGEIRPFFWDRLIPNSNEKFKQTFVGYVSNPYAFRNFLEQKVRTHYFGQAVKNMWHDYRQFQYGGRYGDFTTPELHFKGLSRSCLQRSYDFSGTYAGFNPDNFDFVFTDSVYNSTLTKLEWLNMFANSFLSSFSDNYYTVNSLFDNLGGVQIDTFLNDDLTPNPWLPMLYLNAHKHYVVNKELLRADSWSKKVWFPDDEEDFTFKTGTYNKSTGSIGRFFSPELARSGYHVYGLSVYGALNGSVSFEFNLQNMASNTMLAADLGYTGTPTAGKIKGTTLKITISNFPDLVEYLGFTSISSLATTLEFNKVSDYIKKLFFCSPSQRKAEFKNLLDSELLTNITWGSVSLSESNYEEYSSLAPFSNNSSISGLLALAMPCLLDLLEIRFANFDFDYFTSLYPSPLLQSDYPSLDSDITASVTPTGTVSTTLSGGSVSSSLTGKVGHDSLVGQDFDGQESSFGMFYPAEQGDTSLVALRFSTAEGTLIYPDVLSSDFMGEYAKQFNGVLDKVNNGTLAVNSELTLPSVSSSFVGNALQFTGSVGGVTIPALRLLSATTQYLEALARSDGDYVSFTQAIYGVTPRDNDTRPMYLGGSQSSIVTSDVVQQSETSSNGRLGDVVQRGGTGNKTGIGDVFARDGMVVLGVVSVVPEITYCQGNNRLMCTRDKFDLPSPQFNGLGMQAVYNYEIFVDDDVNNYSNNFEPFGYSGAYDFMRSRTNHVSGLLRPHFNTAGDLLDKPFTQMLQTRVFSECPSLNPDFVSLKDNVTTQYLSVTDTDITPEYIFIFSNEVQAVAPITKRSIGRQI